MQLHIGFAGFFRKQICGDPETASKVASLLIDPRWPWAPNTFYLNHSQDVLRKTRARKAIGAGGQATLAVALGDAAYYKAVLSNTGAPASHEIGVELLTGGMTLPDWGPHPYRIEGQTRGHELPGSASLDAWIALVHELMVTVDIACGVITTWPTFVKCMADTHMSGVTLARPSGAVNLGPPAGLSRENDRANFWRELLGDTKVRHPRWGTYLRRRHLDEIGGLALVRERVEPAKVVELGPIGDLVFIQLTETPEGGLTAEGERKRQVLAEVMAPILPEKRPREAALALL